MRITSDPRLKEVKIVVFWEASTWEFVLPSARL